ncbi:hypothetical protein V202x_21720 [Gimesia aquarii]|uniref:Uncharacterized protein n=1 Tax=Gimesia aquarii TaxID=2527964 RepID=A0A517WU97_9PLAN|nr:hypothetical protein V202x_21720 [Gimesia aquarii]
MELGVDENSDSEDTFTTLVCIVGQSRESKAGKLEESVV